MPIGTPPDLASAVTPPRRKSCRGGYRIDRRHPLAQGLLTCFLFNEGTGAPRDLAGGAGVAFSDANIGWASPNSNGALGVDINGSAGTGACMSTNIHTSPGTITVFILATRLINTPSDGSYNAVQMCVGTNTAGTNNGWAFQLGNGYGGTPNALYASGTCTNLYVNGTAQASGGISDAALVTGQRYAIAGVFSVADDTNPVYFGRFPATIGGQFGMTGSLEMALIYTRALTSNEIAQLTQQTRNGGLPAFVIQPTQAAWLATQSGQALAKALAETLALSDSRRAAAAKALVDSLALSDSRLAAFAKALSDPLTLTDAAARAAGKGLAENLAFTDARTLAATRKLLESLSLSDAGVQAILNAGGQALSKMLSETLALADNRSLAAMKGLVENISLADARVLSLGKKIAEALALTDSRSLAMIRQIAESLGITDNVNAVIGGAALYFFVQIVQSGYKADNNPSSDTTFGGQA